MGLQYTPIGIAYICWDWVSIFFELLIISLRLYSRSILTRSIGSDDFAILVAASLDIVNAVFDSEAFLNGWGEHDDRLSIGQYSSEQKWEYISYIIAYLVAFFVRVSVLLFVLRLLPAYKKRQQAIAYVVFFVNFAITLAACVMFGVSCIPFKANWDAVPAAKCFSKKQLVAVNQVNAILACVCDIAIALIPQFLLWGVQMSRQTKRQLNALFSLGVITAALSIGRAATTTESSLTQDSTWRQVPTYYFFNFETRLGIIFACGPALRQMWSYYHRNRTFLPSARRQYPGEDFQRMHWRINFRDVFWFRQAPMVGNKVYDAMPIFQSRSGPPPDVRSGDPQSRKEVDDSALDTWRNRLKNMLNVGRSQGRSQRTTGVNPSSSVERLAKKRSDSSPSSSSSMPKDSSAGASSSSGGRTFLLSASRASAADHSHNYSMSPAEDYELAEELASPVSRPRQA